VRDRDRDPPLPLFRRLVDLVEGSKAVNFAQPLSASVLVIAAVSVVFPWSTCPIVPTFKCGFARTNFSLAIELDPPEI